MHYRTDGGRGEAPPPSMATAYSQGEGIALGVLIITQMGDRHEVAALVDGHSIIVQMGDALSYRWGTGRSPSPVDGHSIIEVLSLHR